MSKLPISLNLSLAWASSNPNSTKASVWLKMCKPSTPFQNFTDFVKFVDDNMTFTTGSKKKQLNY